MRMALLLSTAAFEDFYGRVMGLDFKTYLDSFRNDFSWYYARGLRDREVDVVLYVPSYLTRGLFEIGDGYRVRFLEMRDWYRVAWTGHRWLSRPPVGRYVQEVANAVSFGRDLLSGLRSDRVDVLYVQEYWTGRFDFLARRAYVPRIGADHGDKGNRQLKIFKRGSFKRASRITCQTEEEALKASRLGARSVFLPNGVDESFFVPREGRAQNPHHKTIITVARLTDAQKRTSDLIGALKYLDDSWNLVVVGDGPDRAALKAKTRALGPRERIRSEGVISDCGALRALYHASDVFAMPSAWEAVSLAVLEALGCGLAVVVSDIPSLRSVIEGRINGIMFTVGDRRQLASSIAEAYELRDLLGSRARETIVRAFSGRAMLHRLGSIVEEAAASGGFGGP